MNVKQIIHVSSAFSPSIGGMEKVASVLATLQQNAGYDVSIFTSDQVKGGDIQSYKSSLKINRLKSFVIANTTIMPGLIRKMLGLSPSAIVHMHVTQAFVPEIVWLISKLRKYHYIAHMHIDTPPSSRFGFLLIPYKKYILKQVLQNAAFVIVFTEKQKIEYSTRYQLRLDRVKVIPNGAEDVFFYDKSRALHKKPRLLFVGRLEFQKNIKQLLHALDGISSNFRTTLVGGGEMMTELTELTNKLKLENVTFVGRAEGSKLMSYYKDADFFVLPSEREGMPLVLLEAMAMGLPIIATDVEGSRDVVIDGENGVLVPYNDPGSLQRTLSSLVGDEKRYKTMSALSREYANKYSWHTVADELIILYSKAAT